MIRMQDRDLAGSDCLEQIGSHYRLDLGKSAGRKNACWTESISFS